MFHRCFPYKRAITEILNNSTEGPQLLLSEREWSQLSFSYTPSVHELLQHLYKIFKVNYLFEIWLVLYFVIFFYLIFLFVFFARFIMRWKMRKISTFLLFQSYKQWKRNSLNIRKKYWRWSLSQVAPSVVQEEVYCTNAWKIQE
jgi:hypothetical protein